MTNTTLSGYAGHVTPVSPGMLATWPPVSPGMLATWPPVSPGMLVTWPLSLRVCWPRDPLSPPVTLVTCSVCWAAGVPLLVMVTWLLSPPVTLVTWPLSPPVPMVTCSVCWAAGVPLLVMVTWTLVKMRTSDAGGRLSASERRYLEAMVGEEKAAAVDGWAASAQLDEVSRWPRIHEQNDRMKQNNEGLEWINLIRETHGNFDSRVNSWKWL